MNQNTVEQREALETKRNIGRKIFKNLWTLACIQVDELQGDVTGEQPWNATSWQERSWQKLAKKCGGRFRVDGCAFDMRNTDNGMLFQKKWGFFSTHVGIAKKINKTCNRDAKTHTHIHGKYTALTAIYPKRLCLTFALALMSRKVELQNYFSDFCFHTGNEAELEDAEEYTLSEGPAIEEQGPASAEPEVAPRSEPAAEDQVAEPSNPEMSEDDLNTLRKIRIIHRNLGHPSQNVLLRMLRTAQVPERVLEIAKRFECDACKTQRHSIPKLPACPPVVTEKWNTVSVDTFWWTNPTKTLEDRDRCVVGISFMDEATDLHVASIVKEHNNTPTNTSGDDFIHQFCQAWLRCLPKPQRLRCDVEKCFEGDKVVTWLEESAIKLDMFPGESPWQLGKHSRHLHTLKQQMSKLAFELGPGVKNEEILSLCLSAKNEVHNYRGYSPNQWAFGQNSERVFSFLDMYHNLPSMNESHPSFEENIEKMAKARGFHSVRQREAPQACCSSSEQTNPSL